MLGGAPPAAPPSNPFATTRVDPVDNVNDDVTEPAGQAAPAEHLPLTQVPQSRAADSLAPAAAVPASTELPPVTGRWGMMIICYNRPQYLQRVLDGVVAAYPSTGGPDIVISQDGDNAGVTSVINKFLANPGLPAGTIVDTMRHEQTREPQDDRVGYHALARHFGWAFSQMFDARGYDRVIALEDDLEVAPDFFSYMAAAARVLEADETVLCVSAWSDLGQSKYAADPTVLLRSDFFPGLGWMINKRVWSDLGPKWPIGYWDDWLREPQNRKGRATIRPEVSRTYTFGEQGVSQSQFYRQYLASINLNRVPVDWSAMDLSYLLKSNYDPAFFGEVAVAQPTTSPTDVNCGSSPSAFRVTYNTVEDLGSNSYPAIARRGGWIPDVKAGVPRTAYGGVVALRVNGCRVFITPEEVSAPP